MKGKHLLLLLGVLLAALSTAVAEDSPWGDEPWPPSGDGSTATGPSTGNPDDADAAPGSVAPIGGFQTLETFRLYGYLSSTVQGTFGEAGSAAEAGEEAAFGSRTRLRLKGDWEPDRSVLFHLEIDSSHTTGTLNGYALMQSAGLDDGSLSDLQSMNPQDDFESAFRVDQAWAQLRFDWADFQIGRQPIAWGTGYAFNPTTRTHPDSGLSEIEDEETPGTAAVVAAIPLVLETTLESYLAFEDRLHSPTTYPGDVEVWNLPWGTRLRAFVGNFDVAVGTIYEVVSEPADSGYNRYLHGAAELVGSVGDVGLYAEGVLTADAFDYEEGYAPDWELAEALETTVGVEYTFDNDLEGKVEYYRRGAGPTDVSDYAVEPLLQGLTSVLGRDYLFGLLSRTFWDYLDLSAAALTNLRDGSGVGISSAEYVVSDPLTISGTIMWPWGDEDSEFGGSRDVDGRQVRLLRPGVMVGAKVSF